jgi:hypothetical protein
MKYRVEYLLSPKPTFIAPHTLPPKKKTNISKQLEYLRGTSSHYLDEQLLTEMLAEDWTDRGLMHNHGRKSLLMGSMLVVAISNVIKSAMLCFGHPLECGEGGQMGLVSCELPEAVLQI